MTARLSPNLAGIRCFACETSHDPQQLLTVCRACGLPLRVDYNLSSLKLSLRDLQSREPSLWRYRELLPLLPGDEVSLVEGLTPLLQVETNVWVKDESRNPTGSFKARGMAVAVSMAKHLGAKALGRSSAGNAAGALAAYGARAGLPVTVAMPEDTPKAFFDECELYGATIHRVKARSPTPASSCESTAPRTPSMSRPCASRIASKARRPWRSSWSSNSTARFPMS